VSNHFPGRLKAPISFRSFELSRLADLDRLPGGVLATSALEAMSVSSISKNYVPSDGCRRSDRAWLFCISLSTARSRRFDCDAALCCGSLRTRTELPQRQLKQTPRLVTYSQLSAPSAALGFSSWPPGTRRCRFLVGSKHRLGVDPSRRHCQGYWPVDRPCACEAFAPGRRCSSRLCILRRILAVSKPIVLGQSCIG